MSRLRARCTDCGTLTAVAVGDGYECHACGRTYAAGLVRVPCAWGRGGELMEDAARLPLPYPEVASVEQETLAAQNLELASVLPAVPLVLGGCCCAHIGAVEGLATRGGRLAVVWLDAHGDLNTPETSPSGNAWGMPLRMLIDSGTVRIEDVALVGARSLDAPEEEFIRASRLAVGVTGIDQALEGAERAYVALDLDVLDPGAGVAVWTGEPGGLSLAELEGVLRGIVASRPLAGAGLTGLAPVAANVALLTRICRALGL